MSNLNEAIEHFENDRGLREEFAFTLAAMKEAQNTIAGLKEPATVWANMLRGEIARPAALEHYEACKAEIERLTADLSTARQSLVEMASQRNGAVAENARLRDSNKHLRNGLMQVIDTLREQGKVFAPAINEIHKHLDESQDMLSPASTRRDIGREVLDSINELKEQDKGYSYEIEYYANGIRSHYIEGCLCSSCEMARRAGKPPESK